MKHRKVEIWDDPYEETTDEQKEKANKLFDEIIKRRMEKDVPPIYIQSRLCEADEVGLTECNSDKLKVVNLAEIKKKLAKKQKFLKDKKVILK